MNGEGPLPTIEAKTGAGEIIQSGSQFMVPFLGVLNRLSKGTKLLGFFKNSPKMKAFFDASVAGFPVDAIGFDPNEQNAANLAARVFSDNKAAALLEEYLGTDPNDSEAFNRFKNGLQGVILGGTFEGVFRGGVGISKFLANHVRNFRKADALSKQQIAKLKKLNEGDEAILKEAQKLDDTLVKRAEEVAPVKDTKATKGSKPKKGDEDLPDLSEEATISKEDSAANTILAEDRIKGNRTEQEFSWKWHKGQKVLKEAEDFSGATARPDIKIDKALVRTIANRIKDGKPVNLQESIATNIDKINGPDDVKRIIKIVEEELGDFLIKGEPLSDDILEQLAKAEGSSINRINFLSEGTQNLARNLRAAELVLVDLADQTMNFMQRLGNNASPEDIVEFWRRVELTSSIDIQIANVKTELGRALASLRKPKEMGMSTLAQLDALSNILGGRRQNTLMAQRFMRLAQEGGLDSRELMKEIAKFARKSGGRKTADAFFEMYVNGLLSRPVTQIVNMFGNASTVVMSISERSMAELGGRAFGAGAGGVARGETKAMLNGLGKGMIRGWALAKEAWRTGKPSEGFKTDMYKPGHRAISGDAFGKVNPSAGDSFIKGFKDGYNSWGFWLDHVGNATRAPGRLLMSGDELFKAVNYDAELHSLAFRRATDLKREGRQFVKTYAQIIHGGDKALSMEAMDFARYQTFTNDLGEHTFSGHIQGLLSHDSALGFIGKTFVPFFRTPFNILKFAGHRAPVFNLMSRKLRNELFRGTLAQKQLVMAKMATGSMAMATSMYLAQGGLITGAPPTNPQERDSILGTGWKPYSIVTPWGYMPYNRFDPIGLMLGMSTDLFQAAARIEDAFDGIPDGEALSSEAWGKYLDASSVGLMSVYSQLHDRHYVAGLSNVFGLIDGNGSDWKQAMRQQFKGMIPPFSFYSSFVKGITQTVDPIVRDQDSNDLFKEFTNILQNDIPNLIGFGSSNLHPKRDDLGEPKLRLGGEMNMAYRAFNTILNPFKISKKDNSLLKNEKAKFGIARGEPWRIRSISDGKVGSPSLPITDDEKELYGITYGNENKKSQNIMKTRAYTGLIDEKSKKIMIESFLATNHETALRTVRFEFEKEIAERTKRALDEEARQGDFVGNERSAVPRNTLTLPLLR